MGVKKRGFVNMILLFFLIVKFYYLGNVMNRKKRKERRVKKRLTVCLFVCLFT